MIKKIHPIAIAIAIISCNPEDRSANEVTLEEASLKHSEIDVTKLESMVGKTLESVQAACEAAKVKSRILEVDGDLRAATMDYLPERINLRIKKGLVTQATNG